MVKDDLLLRRGTHLVDEVLEPLDDEVVVDVVVEVDSAAMEKSPLVA